MKTASVLLITLLFTGFRNVEAQINISLCELNEALHCPCGTQDPLVGHTICYVMQDVNSNGPDSLDDVFAAVEYCQYIAEGCSCAWLPFEPYPGEPMIFYARVAGSANCCWISEEFPLHIGNNLVELSGWQCVPSDCFPQPPFVPLEVWFTDCLQGAGCPCDYPMQFPYGTPVCFWHDVDSNEVSDADTAIACFEIGAGAGLPPWNGEWTPSPDRPLSPGYYYVTINTGVCCWTTGSFLTSNGGGIMMAEPRVWSCFDGACEAGGPPEPPSSIEIICDSPFIEIEWTHSELNVRGYNLYRDGALLTNFYYPEADHYSDEVMVPGLHYEYCVTAFNDFGESARTCAISCTLETGSSKLEKPPLVPKPACVISPNPFNPETTILLELAEDAQVKLAIYDVRGRLVETLADGNFERGNQRFRFDGRNLASGIYFARVQVGREMTMQKLLLLK